MIGARFTSETRLTIAVHLAEGDTLGNMTGPCAFSVAAMVPGNVERDALMDLVAGGALTIAEPTSPPPTDADVDGERDRRLPLGVSYQGHVYQTRPFDIDNMTGAHGAALGAIMRGAQPGDLRWADPNGDFGWIDSDNAVVPMDAHTMLGLAQAAMTRRTALIFAGRAIKDRLAAGEITATAAIAAAFDALT